MASVEPCQTPLRQSKRLLAKQSTIIGPGRSFPRSALARMPSEPTTPRRPQPRRLLRKTSSEPKEVDLKRRRPCAEEQREEALKTTVKPVPPAPTCAAPAVPHQVRTSITCSAAAPVESDIYQAVLDRHDVPQAGRKRLLPLMKHWGPARTAQVMGLWTFLGDGASKTPATTGVQVWGPSGTGKTDVVFGFLQELGIRHVRLNCACFSSLGELQARLAEELRRCAIASLPAGSVVPKELQNKVPPGRQLRALDRIDAAFRPSLEQLADCSQGGRVVVVLDNSQELARLGPTTAELLLVLPEVLENGGQLSFAFVGRMPLCSAFGAAPANEPPAVAFPPYTNQEIEQVLFRVLCAKFADPVPANGTAKLSDHDIRALCGSGLVKFAAPYVGHNLNDLLWLGEEVLKAPPAAGSGIAALQKQIEGLVQHRLGLCDMSNMEDVAEGRDAGEAGAYAILKDNTVDQKRLILAVYLASRIEKDDDLQLFMPVGSRRRMRRHGSILSKKASSGAGIPSRLRAPKSVTLSRLLAVYHRISRQEQLLGPALLENLLGLREHGLLRFADRNCTLDKDCVITCRVELPLARAIARELDVDMAEYLGH